MLAGSRLEVTLGLETDIFYNSTPGRERERGR